MLQTLNKINSISDLAKEVLQIEADSVLELKNRIDEDFEKAIDILYACKGRVIVTGMGKSGHIGRKIAATLSSTGTPSYFLHPAESTHGDSGIITRDDVVIAISNSGETAELMNLLPLIERFGVKMIAMTGKKESTLGKKSDVVLDVSVEKEACPLGKAPTASTTATLAMGDAVAICLLKNAGYRRRLSHVPPVRRSGPRGIVSRFRLDDYRRQNPCCERRKQFPRHNPADFRKKTGMCNYYRPKRHNDRYLNRR